MKRLFRQLAALLLAAVMGAGPVSISAFAAYEFPVSSVIDFSVSALSSESAAESFAQTLVNVTADVENGGGYYTAHTPSTAFPKTAWDGIEAAFVLTGHTPQIRLWEARPSFCSSAVYLAVMKALQRWDTAESISAAAWACLKPYGLDGLRWPYQKDGMGCWGRANANGPGFAVLIAALGAGESRYLGSRRECDSDAAYWAQWEEVRRGDVVKLFWDNYIGYNAAKKNGEGHLVIFLGREKAYDEKGNRDDIIRYWSSNGSADMKNGGYGQSSCRASQVVRAVRTRITNPLAFDNARYIRPDDLSPFLSALDGTRTGTVAELKEALNTPCVAPQNTGTAGSASESSGNNASGNNSSGSGSSSAGSSGSGSSGSGSSGAGSSGSGSSGAGSSGTGSAWLLSKTASYDGRFPDTKGIWCADSIATVFETGMMSGRSDGTFGPYAPLNISHILAISARLHARLTGGDLERTASGWLSGHGSTPASGTWYETYYAYLCSILGVSDLGRCGTEGLCGRDDFAELLAPVLERADRELPVLNTVGPALPDVCAETTSDGLWKAVQAGTLQRGRYEAILSLYRTGILSGFDKYGTFYGSLNRGQCAAMLARVIDPAQRQRFTLSRLDVCRDVLGLDPDAATVTINGTVITANEFSYAFALGRSVENAVAFLKRETVAVELAKGEGYAPTEAELREIDRRAEARDGYGGLNTDAWKFVLRRIAALEYLHRVYLDRYGDDQGTMKHFDGGESYLTIAIGKAVQTAKVTNHLNRLDTAAAASRLSASPYGTRTILSRPMLVGTIPSGIPV